MLTSPGFEVNSVKGANKLYVVGGYSLDYFVYSFVLTNTSNGNASAVVEGTVSDSDICRICLRTDGIVSIIYYPITERYERTVDGIGTICVFYRPNSVHAGVSARVSRKE